MLAIYHHQIHRSGIQLSGFAPPHLKQITIRGTNAESYEKSEHAVEELFGSRRFEELLSSGHIVILFNVADYCWPKSEPNSEEL